MGATGRGRSGTHMSQAAPRASKIASNALRLKKTPPRQKYPQSSLTGGVLKGGRLPDATHHLASESEFIAGFIKAE